MSEMTRDAENEMHAAVQCLYIAVDKSIADDVFSRWIAYKADRRQRIAELEAEVARLTAMQDAYKVAALENANTRIVELEAEVARLQEELHDL